MNNVLDAKAARELAATLGLLPKEMAAIETALGRPPTRTELSVFAGMWSEHCSYKSTRQWLKHLPKDGAHALAGPGSHAGVVAVDDTWAVAFKIESHNHPSAVEPYQGAATGVGGILRDVIAQGARPCAVMDSLCFGEPNTAKQKHLIDGVVSGIGGYGNAFGVPNVGGRTSFDPRYDGNILVNALAAGLQTRASLRTAEGAEPGDKMLYAGATTGRDGILGAAFASEELADDTVEDRPHVQVGDPFTGKKLMEACIAFGPELGMKAGQDMGAAGITCAMFEIAFKSGVGVDIDLETIPLREADMTPQEIMLSESQERFMYAVAAERAEAAVAHFRAHGLHAVICGTVTPGDRARARWRNETVVDLPASLVADGCPPTAWPLAEALPAAPPLPEFEAPADLGKALLGLLADPNVGSTVWLYGGYDQTVGNRTVAGPGRAEAAVLKLPDSTRGFALTISSRGELCGVDPYLGTQASLAEALRDLACVGAPMVAITDGLNVASPRDPVENLKIKRVIEAIGDGLRALEVPVTGGNCSLYNESAQGPIPPTPMIGAIGLVDDVRQVPRRRALREGTVLLLGELVHEPHASRYALWRAGVRARGAVWVDLAATKRLGALLVAGLRGPGASAAKDVGQGGLGVTLAKLAMAARAGMQVTLALGARADWTLFGEPPAAAVVIVEPRAVDAWLALAKDNAVAAVSIGALGGEALVINDTRGGLRLRAALADLERSHGPLPSVPEDLAR